MGESPMAMREVSSGTAKDFSQPRSRIDILVPAENCLPSDRSLGALSSIGILSRCRSLSW